MKIENIHNFFFHPFASEHSTTQSFLSMATIVALTVLTGGLYTLAVAYVNWKERSITQAESNPRMQTIIAPILHPQIAEPRPSRTRISPVPLAAIEGVDQAKVQRVKQKQAEQLAKFETWAQAGQWQNIHQAHYDWWMFPVERPSSGYGDVYAVSKKDVQALKDDKEFMENYRQGVHLVVQAWGWDLEKGEAIQPAASGQKWTGYGVRLAKMSDSLRLFDEIELHEKLKKFFVDYCLPQQDCVPISNFKWLSSTLLD
jgi:hypothetical protein